MGRVQAWILLIAIFLCTTGSATQLLSVGGGMLNPERPKGLIQFEYKGPHLFWTFRPQLGMMTGEYESLYFYGGLAVDLYFTRWFVITPSFSPGLYSHGSGKDLGFPVEFRSSMEFAFEFRNCSRLGVEFYHLSNASLSSKNPGINALVFFIGVPFR